MPRCSGVDRRQSDLRGAHPVLPGLAHPTPGARPDAFAGVTISTLRPEAEPFPPMSRPSSGAGSSGRRSWRRTRRLGEAKYLEVAASVADWILSLPREKTTSGDCLSYVAFKQSSIHNSNMLGAALLAKVGSLTGRARLLEVAKSAMHYSCSRLNQDGSWYYGEEPRVPLDR